MQTYQILAVALLTAKTSFVGRIWPVFHQHVSMKNARSSIACS